MPNPAFKPWQRWRTHFPRYMANQAHDWWWVCLWDIFLRRCVPEHQPGPVLVCTMGKVGTLSFRQTLIDHDMCFVPATHRIGESGPDLPYAPPSARTTTLASRLLFRRHRGSLLRRNDLRVLTAVREPLIRLISLYLFTYPRRYGEAVADAPMSRLRARFSEMFESDVRQYLVPGEFLDREIRDKLGCNLLDHPFRPGATDNIVRLPGRSLLTLRAEDPESQQAEAMSRWIGQDISRISRVNTASDRGYAEVYREFRETVRLPRRYAETIYRSRYMHHFYTEAERSQFWRRWESQLDDSPLPVWLEESMVRHHPPI